MKLWTAPTATKSIAVLVPGTSWSSCHHEVLATRYRPTRGMSIITLCLSSQDWDAEPEIGISQHGDNGVSPKSLLMNTWRPAGWIMSLRRRPTYFEVNSQDILPLNKPEARQDPSLNGLVHGPEKLNDQRSQTYLSG